MGCCNQLLMLNNPSFTPFLFADLPEHLKIAMPALSPTMTQGNVASWSVKEGDSVSAGDVLAEIETDKATMEFESSEDGVVAKILVPAGSKDVPVGKVWRWMRCAPANTRFASHQSGGHWILRCVLRGWNQRFLFSGYPP